MHRRSRLILCKRADKFAPSSQYRVNLHKDHREEPRETIERTDGVTPSEQYLKSLCDRSFLSLWSYPGLCFAIKGDLTAKETA